MRTSIPAPASTSAPIAAPVTRHEVVSRHFGEFSILAVVVVLFIFFSVRADAFLSAGNLVNVARQVAPTVVVAMAMTLVITTGAIDLSVGSIVGLTASVLAIAAATGSPVGALLATVGLGALIGLLNGLLVAYGRVQSFIVTLASLTAVRGVALLITQGYSTPITSPVLIPFGQGQLFGVYTATWIAAIAVAVMWFVLTRTRFGRYVTAVGSNAESLRRSGVDIRRIRLAVMTLSGLFAGGAGVLVATRLSSGSSNSGTGFELEVITAVVLGGTSLVGGRGSMLGSALGALTLGIISNGLVLLHVDVYWVPIVQGLILVVAILVNSRLFERIVGPRA